MNLRLTPKTTHNTTNAESSPTCSGSGMPLPGVERIAGAFKNPFNE